MEICKIRPPPIYRIIPTYSLFFYIAKMEKDTNTLF